MDSVFDISTPCQKPGCGGMARTPRGVVSADHDTLRIKQTDRQGRTRIIEIREVVLGVAHAVARKEITPDEALQQLQAADSSGTVSRLLSRPEWQGISGIAGILSFILALIAVLSVQNGSPSDKTIQEAAERIVEQLQNGRTEQSELLQQIDERLAALSDSAGEPDKPPPEALEKVPTENDLPEFPSKRKKQRERGKAKEASQTHRWLQSMKDLD